MKQVVKRAVQKLVPSPLETRMRDVQVRYRLQRAERAVARESRPAARPHGLPGELVVSLTSHPPRFGTLAKTLRGLLDQSVAADRTVLWLTEEHKALLPPEVLALVDQGLSIETCEEMRSFAKIVPALRKWPGAYIVTADDDLYYEPDWLATLVAGVVPDARVIVCRRALRPIRNGHGFAPSLDWELDVVTRGEVRDDLYPTGVGGVLYPPGSLAPEVLDTSSFMRLCPTEDDIWLYWMGRRAGAKVRQVGGGFAQVAWPGSQDVTLLSTNIGANKSDGQLAAVIAAYPEA